jgi:RNA polymerase sigma-70 factor, ECF subfamily
VARYKRPRKDAPLDETIETTVADSADNAEVVLEKKHQAEVLRDALNKLSPEHREIIDLVYYHEKSVDDAADILS